MPTVISSQETGMVYDHQPDFEFVVNGQTNHGWLLLPESGEIRDTSLCVPGFRAEPSALRHLGTALVRSHPDTAAVIYGQPDTTLSPRTPDEFADKLRWTARPGARERRMRAAEACGLAVCRYLKVPSLKIVGHSLGALDAVKVAAQTDKFAVSEFTAIAAAGFLKPLELPEMLTRMPWLCNRPLAPRVKSGHQPLRRFADALRSGRLQRAACEGLYGLTSQTVDDYARLRTDGVPTYAVEMANDEVWGSRRQSGLVDNYTVIHEDWACHHAATRANGATVIARAMRAFGEPT